MNAIYKDFLGQVLSEKRRIADLNKRQLSMMTGISRVTIRKIELGDSNPSIDVLLRLTQGIGIPLSELIDECERRLRAQVPPEEFDEPYILMQR